MSSIIRLRKGVIGVILLPSHRHMPAPRAYPTRLATEVAITEHEYQLRRSRSVQSALRERSWFADNLQTARKKAGCPAAAYASLTLTIQCPRMARGARGRARNSRGWTRPSPSGCCARSSAARSGCRTSRLGLEQQPRLPKQQQGLSSESGWDNSARVARGSGSRKLACGPSLGRGSE